MSIKNTANDEKHVEWLFGGNPGAIESQEKRGQDQVVASSGTTLPVDGSNTPEIAALGIKFGDPVEGDPLFRHAELPDGWSVKATDHSMWSDVVDANGKAKASIFYKAAFYDRRARISPAQ